MEHCEKYRALISAAVDGELPEAAGELMDHLAQCSACREVYGQMMAMHEAFSQLDTKCPGPGRRRDGKGPRPAADQEAPAPLVAD